MGAGSVSAGSGPAGGDALRQASLAKQEQAQVRRGGDLGPLTRHRAGPASPPAGPARIAGIPAASSGPPAALVDAALVDAGAAGAGTGPAWIAGTPAAGP